MKTDLNQVTNEQDLSDSGSRQSAHLRGVDDTDSTGFFFFLNFTKIHQREKLHAEILSDATTCCDLTLRYGFLKLSIRPNLKININFTNVRVILFYF